MATVWLEFKFSFLQTRLVPVSIGFSFNNKIEALSVIYFLTMHSECLNEFRNRNIKHHIMPTWTKCSIEF